MSGHETEVFTLWSAARAEANVAYDDWCASPGDQEAYIVYRAAEDRADAAEAEFASVAAPTPLLV